MPKSKRSKTYHLTQVSKKTRADKEALFQNIRDTVPKFAHCFVLSFDNMRNNHLKEVRRELADSRIFLGKTKLMARALGTDAASAAAPGTPRLTAHLRGAVALLCTDRAPAAVAAYCAALARADFARAGAAAAAGVALPAGAALPPAVGAALEPELRRLGVPTRLVRGRVVLAAASAASAADAGTYVVCRPGDVLDGRQTRLLKLLDQRVSEFRVRVLAYWTAEDGLVTEVDPRDGPAMAVDAEDEE